MYIVRTTTGDTIRIDYDELHKIAKASNEDLIVFRQGMVAKRMISVVILDPEARRRILRLPGETEEDIEKKLKEHKSDTIFPQIQDRPQLR